MGQPYSAGSMPSSLCPVFVCKTITKVITQLGTPIYHPLLPQSCTSRRVLVVVREDAADFAVTKDVQWFRACQFFDVHAIAGALTVFFTADRKFASIHYPWTSTNIRLFSRGRIVLASPPCLRALGFTCLRLSQASIGQLSAATRLPSEWAPPLKYHLPRRKSFVMQRLSRIAVIELSSFK